MVEQGFYHPYDTDKLLEMDLKIADGGRLPSQAIARKKRPSLSMQQLVSFLLSHNIVARIHVYDFPCYASRKMA